MIVLIILWWFFAALGALLCFLMSLCLLSIAWASWRQKRQERRERKAISTSDLKASLDRRTNDLLTKYMHLDARVNQLERARDEARKEFA